MTTMPILSYHDYVNDLSEECNKKTLFLYQVHNPIVHRTLQQVLDFMRQTNAETGMWKDDTARLEFDDLAHLFSLGSEWEFNAIISALFWYFLYKTPTYRVYNFVSYDSDFNAFILLSDGVNRWGHTLPPHSSAFGFNVKYLDYFYRRIDDGLKASKLDPFTPAYFFKLLDIFDNSFNENGELILLN